MIDTRAALAAFRASTLAATRDNGTPTGPGIEADVDMVAARCFASGAHLLTALQCDHTPIRSRRITAGRPR